MCLGLPIGRLGVRLPPSAPAVGHQDVRTCKDAAMGTSDELVRTLPSLDDGHALPSAPRFPQNTEWSARRIFVHIIAETAQHAEHADIPRESIDGSKTMGRHLLLRRWTALHSVHEQQHEHGREDAKHHARDGDAGVVQRVAEHRGDREPDEHCLQRRDALDDATDSHR
ncbi:MAG: DUF664 domain-containing protein [Actinobacteria bacterium]|nr:DUF664 domain-containing protein [Actinomycetota bacterium]